MILCIEEFGHPSRSEQFWTDRALVFARNEAYAAGMQPDDARLPTLTDVLMQTKVSRWWISFLRDYWKLMCGRL